jgi:hypothetical protein
MAKFKRKKLYVDPVVQLQLMRRIVMHWLSFFGIAVVLALCFEMLFENPFEPLSALVGGVFERHGLLLIALLALIPAFVYDTIKLSNRFAGPMLRFRRAITQLGEGETIEPLKFRDGDFWKDLADDFNRVLARLAKAEADRNENAADEAEADDVDAESNSRDEDCVAALN